MKTPNLEAEENRLNHVIAQTQSALEKYLSCRKRIRKRIRKLQWEVERR
jgi:predicted  nucleic acid-binding Zn-ribbon protein